LTKSNDPALLARIRAEAWAQLIEMAQWLEAWRIDARMAIARIAGIPETRWGEVLLLPNEEFLRAVNPR
jgi:hypothetical protein